jgi:hypothetical protein
MRIDERTFRNIYFGWCLLYFQAMPRDFGSLAPLQTGFIFFNNFFGEKEMPMKNGENHMKKRNKSFRMVYGLPK